MLDFQNDRDATLKLIDWFRIDRVREARVLVVGAGAIGNEVLKNLALLGVGYVYVFDLDTIEMSNLSRSVLYRPADRGSSKAETAANAVKQLNPTVNAYWHHGDIRDSLGEGFIREMDVVIGCLDNVDARFLLNRLCRRAGRPWIDAGISTMSGRVRVFEGADGACYECGFTEERYETLSIRQPCNALADQMVAQGRLPTTPTIASVVAGIQVQECLKLLDPEHWNGRSLAGREFTFEGSVCFVDIVALPVRPDCPAHVVIEDHELLQLEDMTAHHSAGDLLDIAQRRLEQPVVLAMPHDIALVRMCAGCGARMELYRALHKVSRQELTCPTCGRESVWQSDINQDYVVSASSPPALLAARLTDLGVPRCGYVEVRCPDGNVRYLLLAGDRAGLVNTATWRVQ